MAILSTPLQYLTSIPPVTRGFTLATLAASSLYLWIWWTTEAAYIPYLTLVPGSSLFYPWTFVTSALVEVTILELVFSLIVVPPSLRYFERLWGTIETLKFILVRPVSALGNAVYKIATRLHLIPSSTPHDIESGYSQVPGSARAEAERRRALALKALDQRLATSGGLPAQNGPSQAQQSRPSPATSVPPAERKAIPGEVDVTESGSTDSEER
ncbi:hypothetical protein ID866_6021 [Astraeus odoratus]|nr:hypothetical protein ID866_6021 [Astraeus odoratus]